MRSQWPFFECSCGFLGKGKLVNLVHDKGPDIPSDPARHDVRWVRPHFAVRWMVTLSVPAPCHSRHAAGIEKRSSDTDTAPALPHQRTSSNARRRTLGWETGAGRFKRSHPVVRAVSDRMLTLAYSSMGFNSGLSLRWVAEWGESDRLSRVNGAATTSGSTRSCKVWGAGSACMLIEAHASSGSSLTGRPGYGLQMDRSSNLCQNSRQ